MKRFNVLLLIAAFSMNASWAASNLEGSRDKGPYEVARAHAGLGIYYSQQMNFTAAIVEYNKALKIQEFTGEKRALCLRNLANAYHNLGDIYARKKNFTAAITQYTTALAIEEFVGKERALCHYILGDICTGQKNSLMP
jgi:tetratricopeptide (TPR) repeat protein